MRGTTTSWKCSKRADISSIGIWTICCPHDPCAAATRWLWMHVHFPSMVAVPCPFLIILERKEGRMGQMLKMHGQAPCMYYTDLSALVEVLYHSMQRLLPTQAASSAAVCHIKAGLLLVCQHSRCLYYKAPSVCVTLMCCAGPMLLACIGNSLWQLVLEVSIFACQKPVLL